MESQQGENLGAVGQGIVTGFLLLLAYYLMSHGTGYYAGPTIWVWAIVGLFVLTSIFLILSVILLVQRQSESKNLLVIGSMILLLLVIVVGASTVARLG